MCDCIERRDKIDIKEARQVVRISWSTVLLRMRSFIWFSELKFLSLKYDKMVSHMMPHVH
jgi:hypothetical protein